VEIYAVHAVRHNEVRPTELVCSNLAAAEANAAALSQDPGVLAAAVTRFTMDAPGARSGVALYVAGRRQAVPYVSDDRRINSSGCPT
jgi:hypothetical protein